MRINKTTVKTLIDRYGYYAYLIRLNKAIKCECVNPSTKESNPKCKKCLGTGYQIRVSKYLWRLEKQQNKKQVLFKVLV